MASILSSPKVLMRALYIRVREKQPAHLAYPTPKVKILTCGISGIGGMFLVYNK